MDSQNPNNNFPELIYKYLSGNASDAEVQSLEAWVLADSKNKKEFIAFKKAWILSGMKEDQSTINVEQLWKETSGKVFSEAKTVSLKPRQSRRTWLSIAATISLLLVAAFWFFQTKGTTPMVVKALNEIENFNLPDGSKITLNQSSTLSYTFLENDKKRKVDLKGDAFFEVARDEQNPFIINTEGIEVEVLGTSFYVDGREQEDAIVVIVQSGSVAVRYGSKETVLKNNEKAIFRKNTQTLEKVQNEDANYKSIQTNILTFENSKLEEVVFALNRHFNADISIENEVLKNCELTAVYENKSLDALLKIIEESIRGVEVKQLGNKITLNGLSCN